MSLQLLRPIAFIDLETTGINISTDKIIEIAIVKILVDGTKVSKRKLINPQMPIPESSTAVHGITNEMVKDAPTFKQVANEIKQFLESDQYKKEVQQEINQAYQEGVSGVPHFRINDKIQLSGAQDPQQFIQAFRKVGVKV